MDDYLLSENLLFYTSHFFRRALWGTFVVKVLHIRDYQTFFYIVYTSIFLSVLLYFLFINKNILLRILYLASPLGFLFVGDKRAFMRKETLFIPFIFLVISILKSKQTQTAKLAWLLLFSFVMICIHDTFLFLVFPLFVYLLMRQNFERKYLIFYSLVVVAFTLITGIIPVSPVDAAILNNFFSAKHIGWDFTRQGLTRNLAQTLDVSLHHLSRWNFVLFSVVGLLHILLLLYFFREKFREHKTFFILQAVFLAALFTLAMDYGRWIAFAFFNSCLLLSIYSKGKAELNLKKNDWYKLAAIIVVMLCIRVPIWSYFHINDPRLYSQLISPVVLNALNLPGNDF
jgi:hypothetical protein